MKNQSNPPVWLFTILRIIIGWHLLYEGIAKLIHPSWSAAPFLMESKWIFSDFFKALATDQGSLAIVNFLNIWGLILIGLGLFFGLFTRIASWSGAVLIFMYYLAYPPFTGLMDVTGKEGNFIWINKNFIEMFTLILLANIPKDWMFSLDNLISFRRKEKIAMKPKGAVEIPVTDNPDFSDMPLLDRRRIIKNLVTVPLMGGFLYAVLKNFGYESNEERNLKLNAYSLAERGNSIKVNAVSSASVVYNNYAKLADLKEQVPSAKIGNVNVSRLIIGGNLMVGYAHARDLVYVSQLVSNYNTQEKLWETFRLCEACGVNTLLARTAPDVVEPLTKYWKQGGKMQWIASTYPREEDLYTNTQVAIDLGAPLIMFYGGTADTWVSKGRFDLFDKWFSHFQGKGFPLGVACHDLAVVKAMEEKGYPIDFYFKTYHNKNYWSYVPEQTKDNIVIGSSAHHDNYWCPDPEETAAFMETVKKPWIGFKLLAAGALRPEAALKNAFENGVDFACVGMFDYQVVQDCNVTNSVLKSMNGRRRAVIV